MSTGRVVLSVMGPHAGESVDAIFERKIEDVRRCGRTFWLFKSPAANPSRATAFKPERVLFLAPVAKNGARPTTASSAATEFSRDGVTWETLPAISPITGKLPAYALVLSTLALVDEEIDLGAYVTYDGKPVVFRLGASTLLAQPVTSATIGKRRRVIAVGRIEDVVRVR